MPHHLRALRALMVAIASFATFTGASHAGIFETIVTKGVEKAGQKFSEGRASASRSDSGATAGSPVGFASCPQFFPEGRRPSLPASSKSWKLRELCYDAFAVLHSGATHTPIFAVERLNRAQLADAKGETRTNAFFADARLPTAERAELTDYSGSGCDRGHMSAAANQPTAQAMAQSFSLANMVCQAPENNRKTWANVERDTRRYVERARGDVYVFTGPAFLGERVWLKNRVQVPSHIFKLVYDATTHRAWAHFIANTNEARIGPPISYEELTGLLGFELLPGLALQQQASR